MRGWFEKIKSSVFIQTKSNDGRAASTATISHGHRLNIIYRHRRNSQIKQQIGHAWNTHFIDIKQRNCENVLLGRLLLHKYMGRYHWVRKHDCVRINNFHFSGDGEHFFHWGLINGDIESLPVAGFSQDSHQRGRKREERINLSVPRLYLLMHWWDFLMRKGCAGQSIMDSSEGPVHIYMSGGVRQGLAFF